MKLLAKPLRFVLVFLYFIFTQKVVSVFKSVEFEDVENYSSILMLNCFANISFTKIFPQWYEFLPRPCWLEATNYINLNYTRAEKHVYELYTHVLKDFDKESLVFRFC